MKKHFKYLSMAAIAASMFAACSDVPELPYPFPGDNSDTTEVGGIKTLPYSESFSSSLGEWTNETTSGEGAWINDYSTAKATGYDNASQTTTAGTYYLISPEISLEGVEEAYIAYEYILRYNKGDENQKILISANYTDDATMATWAVLKADHTEGADWVTFESADINIPAEYMGKTIRIAFYYNTNNVSGSTWEVRNFAIAEGKASEGDNDDNEDPDTPGADIPDGESLLTNCSFENWTGGKPTGWAGVSSNATISQSTDAHQGVYSVLVEGATTNKRFTSGTVTLKAGTYGISAYLKQSGDAAGKFRLGYVKLTNGAVANTSTDYIYITEPANVGSEWEQATCAFELTEDTELAIIIMNSKNGNGNAILVDDVTLTTEDGGLTEGGNEEEPETPGDETYSGKYIKVTEFTGAGTYLLVSGDQAFTQLDATKTYGYMPAATVSISNGEIAASAATEAAKLTITATDGGYTLQDASARYIYMKGTYNSFNIGTTAEESYVWTITANGDDTFSVTNADMGKTIMYDTQYSSFGSYPDKTDTRLYVNIYKYIAE